MINRWPVPSNLSQLKTFLNRLHNSAVVWSWGFNAVRLVSGIVLLPLVLRELSPADLGMYYVLLSLVALAPIIDFGFGPTIGRFIGYAMGGARTLQAQGVFKSAESAALPNYTLLWQLLATTRTLYRYIAIGVFVIMGIWGTYVVELRIGETSSELITRLAWGITLVATVFDIYWNWWSTYLLGMNEVRSAARIGLLAMLAKLVMASVLLLSGAGLLSVPIGSLVGSAIWRGLARMKCLALLKNQPRPEKIEIKENFRILWPNSWRLGIQFMSGYLTLNANTAICLAAFGLAANARYGLSIQLMNIAAEMAAVWTGTKWPQIAQFQARHEHLSIQRVLRPRFWLQNVTFLILAGGIIFCGPTLLRWFGSGKEMLPSPWLQILMLYAFLNMQFVLWGTLIATGNRLSYLWPTVATNVLSLMLSLALVHFTTLGLGALVLGPLLAGIIFNYWYWPPFAARGIGTTLFHFIFFGPSAKNESRKTPV
jgi:O-antigen/teichoic acid export membrane protein